ncbi:hypothetical protein SAMN05428970_0964 [Agromyces sp. CF514]|uniref:hypothetical protein n=1 Tax=Agromyces sp. CF514 TaxID=1881031 RepID=UPI0008ED4955|nr:hypothetical protein [Agromyces sp. CF514]SFR70510.1 hypothetical protein SAMN05428970_0964 [Agromyces sp. CF514]
MPEAPNAPERARTPLKQVLVRDVAPVLAVLLITFGLWVGFTIIAPENAEAADPAEPVVVYSAERDYVVSTALAGARRGALDAVVPLRAAVKQLDGFADAAILADARKAIAALDAALSGDETSDVVAATAVVREALPGIVERFAANADARIAAAASADAALAQRARDAVAAVRAASASERAALAAGFAPMRARVEAAEASHAEAVARAAAEAAEEAESDSDGGSSDGGPGPLIDCADSTTSTPWCPQPLVVTTLGAYVSSCPAGTWGHVFDLWMAPGTITLDYPFPYTYSVMDGTNLSALHCDPESADTSIPHGPGPLPG